MMAVFFSLLIPTLLACEGIPIIEFSSAQFSASDVIAGGCPRLFRGSPAAHWPAVKGKGGEGGGWSPVSLAAAALKRVRSPSVFTVKTSADPVFMYEDATKPLQGSQCQIQKLNFSMHAFFLSLAEAGRPAQQRPGEEEEPRRPPEEKEERSVDKYRYFSDGVRVLKEVSQDILPIDFISRDKRCDINFWAGTKQVTAFPHYDLDDNFFVQIFGRKRMTLISPAEWVNSANNNHTLFPHMHVLHRQLQHDTEAGVSVELSPGDLLYIPPFWLHRVTALDTAFSVNFWCSSAASQTASSLLSLPLPFDHTPPARAALAQYIHTLLAVCETIPGRGFSGLRSRYSRYFQAGWPQGGIWCEAGDTSGEETRDSSTGPVEPVAAMSGEGHDRFVVAAQRVRGVLGGVGCVEGRQVLLEDFLEELLQWGVGTDNLARFMYACL